MVHGKSIMKECKKTCLIRGINICCHDCSNVECASQGGCENYENLSWENCPDKKITKEHTNGKNN